MINIETGADNFISVINSHPEWYGDKADRWTEHTDYNRKNNYKPSKCDTFCPYNNSCIHAKNILTTVHKSNAVMEKTNNCNEEYYPISEIEKDLIDALYTAYDSPDEKIYVIKAQTAVGKSTAFLKLMKEKPDSSILVAAPTNLLKEELTEKAKKNGIKIKMTPSLENIIDQLPKPLHRNINKLYACGLGKKVQPLIRKAVEKNDIPCLKEYLEKRKELLIYNGSLITTHKYLLSMDKNRLDKFDCIIIDEDVIFKSIISNQGEISVSDLRKLKNSDVDPKIKRKASDLLKMFRTNACIYGECSICWDDLFWEKHWSN